MAAAAAILTEVLRSQKRYDAKAMVDWLVKIARAAEGYAKLDQGQPHDTKERDLRFVLVNDRRHHWGICGTFGRRRCRCET
jgi:hypothetical protein